MQLYGQAAKNVFSLQDLPMLQQKEAIRMFAKTIWETSLPPERCREALQSALEGPHDWEDVRGMAFGNRFRLKALTRPRFWRRGRLQYTLYGTIAEGENGRTHIITHRFRGCAEPLTFLLLYPLVLLMLCSEPGISDIRELPFRAGLALLCCVLAAGAERVGYLFRTEESDILCAALDNFLRDTLSAWEAGP